jgi:hypothetical protein
MVTVPIFVRVIVESVQRGVMPVTGGGSPSSLALYPPHGIAYLRARQATKRACCFHPSVSANCRQAASNRAWLGARAEA